MRPPAGDLRDRPGPQRARRRVVRRPGSKALRTNALNYPGETVMVRITDVEASTPRPRAGQPEPGHDQKPAAAQPAGYGMANYSRIFSSRREGADHRPDMSLDAYIDKLGKLGIVRSVPFGITN